MDNGMQRLSLNSSTQISDFELRTLEQKLIQHAKEGKHEEALQIVNKIVSADRGNIMTLEIQKLLKEKKELDEYSTSEEYSSSGSEASDSGDEEESKGSTSSKEEEEEEAGSEASFSSSSNSDEEAELCESETLWGRQGKSKPAAVASGPRKPKHQPLSMSKQERTALKSKLMSDLMELKQQSPYKKK